MFWLYWLIVLLVALAVLAELWEAASWRERLTAGLVLLPLVLRVVLVK
jgi:hypothetical protein